MKYCKDCRFLSMHQATDALNWCEAPQAAMLRGPVMGEWPLATDARQEGACGRHEALWFQPVQQMGERERETDHETP